MKIVFAGTPEIAKIILARILAEKFVIDLVLTKPDRPSGRGKKLSYSQVKQFALQHNLAILQPESLKTDRAVIEQLKTLQPDLMLVVAYGLILPQQVLEIPKLGCINIHVSLLPKYRGAAPIQRAVLDGETVTGVTIMQMDRGLDTGAILLQEQIALDPRETSGTLHDKLAVLGADLLIKYLNGYQGYQAYAQSESGISYAEKIEKTEAGINWLEDAFIIDRKVRGFNPFPGAFTYLDGELVKIWCAAPVKNSTTAEAGTIIEAHKNGILVKCGHDTALNIHELQKSGKTRQTAGQYLAGHADIIHKIFKDH